MKLALSAGLGGCAVLVAAMSACGGGTNAHSDENVGSSSSDLKTSAASSITLDIGGDRTPVELIKGANANADVQVFAARIPLPLTPSVSSWLAEFFTGVRPRRDGTIVLCSTDHKPCEERSFYDALVSEVSFPAGSGDSKDATFINVKWVAETISNLPKDAGSPNNPPPVNQPTFLPTAFKLSLDGAPISAVMSVDGITIKQSNVRDDIGEARDTPLDPPSKIAYPLRITITGDFTHEDFAINGNNEPEQHKTASITYLNPVLGGDLLTLNLHTMGIFKGTKDVTKHGTDQITFRADSIVLTPPIVLFDGGQ